MGNKKFILNADDFGMSQAFNKAVVDAYNDGFLTSTSLCANGEAFNSAANEIIPECPNLGIGVHLNIIEGKSILPSEKIEMLVDSQSNFKNGYLTLIKLAEDSEFLAQVESEFRAQIEKIANYTRISHLDSHVHTHAIPNIFDITCKLAKEYGIKQIRTQQEEFYLVPNIKKHINLKYPPNILKIILLNSFTQKNRQKIKDYKLNTNDYLIGVGYTGMMDEETVYHGLKAIKDENAIVEALIHPCNYNDPAKTKNQHQIEFNITKNFDLKDKIQRLGFEITNYKG